MEEKKTTAKERVEAEAQELKEKILKLDIFLRSENFMKLKPAMQELLKEQLHVMCNYKSILCDRLVIWDD